METIIGLLFILLPVIFKLIGNKLEKAGQTEKAGKVRELAEIFGSSDEPEVEYDDDGQIIDVPPVRTQPAPVQPEPVCPEPVVQPEPVMKPKAKAKQQKPKSEPVMPVEEKVKKEKIDPKKLVIYSEIMEPKYKQN